MKLCIAEKPSVAKELATILGARKRMDGYFEGEGYQVTWTYGHLCTLKEPDDYTEVWKKWRLELLPILPPRFGIKLISNEGYEKQFSIIKKLADNCTEVINCGDAGIEGELIQRWVLTKASCNKPLKRLWISSLTDEAIKEGFKKLKDGSDFDRLYAAGNARAIGDWLLGMNATRLYTLKYAKGKGVLSVGRVQTPTLALIVNRFLEIQNFKPESYWELKTVYRTVTFSSAKGKFKRPDEAAGILETIRNEEFEITDFQRKPGKEQPPRLFDLTALQVEGNKKFGFTAEQTLTHIQSLYEKKLVTYPRVDTTYLPDDVYPDIKKILEKLTPYANFTAPLLDKPIKKSKKVFDNSKVTDHHAIIPTGVHPSSGMLYQEKQVYDMVTRRFIAAFYPDCDVSNTTVTGEAAGYEFKASGKEIVKEGWRVLYPKKDKEEEGDNDETRVMPTFVKGEKGPHEPDVQEKQTQPPKHYTEATLLRAMETAGKQVEDEELRDLMKDNGIGRPSTRANIIETLFRRKYVNRQNKNLVPTQTGIQLIQTISNELLKSVELTGQWEKKLRQIEQGAYDPAAFIGEMKEMVSTLVNEVKREWGKTIEIEQTEEKPVAEEGDSKEKKPVKKATKEKSDKKPAGSKKKKADTPPEGTATITQTQVFTCPVCSEGTMLKGKAAWGCSRYAEGCRFVIPFEKLKEKTGLDDLNAETLMLFKRGV